MRAYAAINRLRHRFLAYGRVAAWSPSIQGPGGTVLRDYSGRGNDGTLVNMDPATDWVVSGGQRALDFDGTNDHVSLGDVTTFDGLAKFTVSLWCNLDAASLQARVLIGKNDSGQQAFTLQTHYLTSKLWGLVGGTQVCLAVSYLSSYVGPWLHIVWVYDSSSGNRIFVNGSEDSLSIDTTNGSIPSTTAPVQIAGQPWVGANRYAKGQFDDIAIYDRALPHAEIKLLALRRGIAYEQTEFEPYVTQWGSVAAAAEEAAGGFIGGGMGSFF